MLTGTGCRRLQVVQEVLCRRTRQLKLNGIYAVIKRQNPHDLIKSIRRPIQHERPLAKADGFGEGRVGRDCHGSSGEPGPQCLVLVVSPIPSLISCACVLEV